MAFERGRRVYKGWINAALIPGDLYNDDAYLPMAALEFADGNRLLVAHTAKQSETLRELTKLLVGVLGACVLVARVMS